MATIIQVQQPRGIGGAFGQGLERGVGQGLEIGMRQQSQKGDPLADEKLKIEVATARFLDAKGYNQNAMNDMKIAAEQVQAGGDPNSFMVTKANGSQVPLAIAMQEMGTTVADARVFALSSGEVGKGLAEKYGIIQPDEKANKAGARAIAAGAIQNFRNVYGQVPSIAESYTPEQEKALGDLRTPTTVALAGLEKNDPLNELVLAQDKEDFERLMGGKLPLPPGAKRLVRQAQEAYAIGKPEDAERPLLRLTDLGHEEIVQQVKSKGLADAIRLRGEQKRLELSEEAAGRDAKRLEIEEARFAEDRLERTEGKVTRWVDLLTGKNITRAREAELTTEQAQRAIPFSEYQAAQAGSATIYVNEDWDPSKGLPDKWTVLPKRAANPNSQYYEQTKGLMPVDLAAIVGAARDREKAASRGTEKERTNDALYADFRSRYGLKAEDATKGWTAFIAPRRSEHSEYKDASIEAYLDKRLEEPKLGATAKRLQIYSNLKSRTIEAATEAMRTVGQWQKRTGKSLPSVETARQAVDVEFSALLPIAQAPETLSQEDFDTAAPSTKDMAARIAQRITGEAPKAAPSAGAIQQNAPMSPSTAGAGMATSTQDAKEKLAKGAATGQVKDVPYSEHFGTIKGYLDTHKGTTLADVKADLIRGGTSEDTATKLLNSYIMNSGDDRLSPKRK